MAINPFAAEYQKGTALSAAGAMVEGCPLMHEGISALEAYAANASLFCSY